MEDVAIVGAGELGGVLAHTIAQRDLARSVTIIDDRARIAVGKALDIMQARPIEGFSCEVSGTADMTRAAGAAVVLIADRAGGGEWEGSDGFTLLKGLARLTSGAVVLCAGARQRELVEHGVQQVGYGRFQLLGSAPEALAAAMRALVALEANASPRDVGLTLLGVPPGQIVIPWAEATIGGLAVTHLLDEPTLRQLQARAAPLWPPGPLTLAAAAARAAALVLGRSRQRIAAFVAPDDSLGRRMRTVALPVFVDATGELRADVPALNPHDRMALDNAMLL